MLLTSNPFDRLFPYRPMAATSIRCCKTTGMVFHRTTLYMGYVGFSVAFAFAHRSPYWRQPGRHLGALDAPLDHGCVGLPDSGYLAGQQLGLLRAGLGRLVVFGTLWKTRRSCHGFWAQP